MKRAFTLIELMVVISIIGLLAAITLPRFADVTQDAKVAQVQGNLANLRTSIGIFHARHGFYPVFSKGSFKASEDTDAGDIYSSGDLSESFTQFYSREKLPETPASEGTPASGSVVDERDDEGGWLYLEEEGEIYANLENGNYTGDEDQEIWNEEGASDPGDGGNPGEGGSVGDLGSLIPDGSDSWKIHDNGDLEWIKGEQGNNKHGDLIFTEENTGLEKISEITFTSPGKINGINFKNTEYEVTSSENNGVYTYTVKFNDPQPTPIDSTIVWFPNAPNKVITGVEVKS